MTDNPLRQDHGPAGPEGAGGFEALLAAAVRSAKQRDGAQERAVAAFREARDQGAHSARTRRRDDWRPRSRGLARWSLRTTVGTLVAGVALGGVAMAGIGAVGDAPGDDAGQRPTPGRSASGSPGRPTPERVRPSATVPAPSHAPGRSAGHPDQAGDTLAKCHAYASVRDRGEALDSAAWRRFLAEAGGATSVDAYCAAERARQETGNGSDGSSGSDGSNGSDKAAGGKADSQQSGHPSPSPKPSRAKNPQK
ncbi:hypothetical protein OHO83_19435 [Streptomyces sp. NBC_00569]|uniref:hypothetical protein n=1 Tax=unclassified Streptomyces TaxID=2593676 RepID=UPI0022500E5B|nr:MULTISPECIES: hypothetical protein [unclassified Streptomyces]MCX5439213.1 hypothetical protein [Streptomyces sp. NBC_00063]WUB94307.1 hypothetical protein OHO83_19435 [Streptomyces sp. NBC_00569]